MIELRRIQDIKIAAEIYFYNENAYLNASILNDRRLEQSQYLHEKIKSKMSDIKTEICRKCDQKMREDFVYEASKNRNRTNW